MARLELTDTAMDVIVKMAEGNPGAAIVMGGIMKDHDRIDPQSMMGGIGALMALDGHGIYGSAIYVLFSDKCNKDMRRMLMLVRATQLGHFPASRLKEMAADQTRQVNLTEDEFTELDQKVCKQLTEFAKAA
jgi:hypothetical protein